MSVKKKYLGQLSTHDVKRAILEDFYQALRLELRVELSTSDGSELFSRSSFYLKLDSGKVVQCEVFPLIQCFELKKKEKIDKALRRVLAYQGSISNNRIQVEQNESSFMFYELVKKED